MVPTWAKTEEKQQKWLPVCWALKIVYIYPEITLPSGDKQTIRCTQRTMFVTDPNAFLDSGNHRIFVVKRGNDPLGYSLSTIPRVEQSKWTNPDGVVAPWYKDGDKYKRDGKTLSEKDFLQWLTVRLGAEEAGRALHMLLTEEPTK